MTAPKSDPVAGPRKPGRPKGSTTKNRATPTGPQSAAPAPPPADAILSPDDKAASAAERIAAGAVPPKDSSAGGRPTARESSLTGLALSLSEQYQAVGGILAAAGQLVVMFEPSIGLRLLTIGEQLVRSSDKCGLALARWAEAPGNAGIKRFLSKAATGAGLLAVLAAHLPILAAVVGHGDKADLAEMAGNLITSDGDGAAGDPLDQMAAAMSSMFSTMFAGADGPTGVPADPTFIPDLAGVQTNEAPAA